MLSPTKYEIDHHILKLIVGVIALSIASVTAVLASAPLDSISASYHAGGAARDVFVGFLFAISAFLLAYNGFSVTEMALSKTAAVAAFLVAVFPCHCEPGAPVLSVHGVAAAIMFLVLACFCAIFYGRARAKHRREADWRATIYAACGAVIVVAVGVLAIDGATGGRLFPGVARLTFYGERAGLMAFGVSWLVASRALPFLTAADERISVLPVVRDQSK